MKSVLKIPLYASLPIVGLILIVVATLLVRARWELRLPSQETARKQFANHRTEYVRFVALLREDPDVRVVDSDGAVDTYTGRTRVVPQYRDLMGKIGAKSVLVRGDGSIEFTIWGFGCTICSDSFMGIRYSPMNHTKQGRAGWVPTLVSSLDSRSLPQENGSVATGLYVVRLEPEWFIYRLEYRE
jgi:hypothetical protein